jgi:phage I-like protein
LKVDDRGLWAHVEWLEPARSYIREGKYRWVSPTIRFRARHPETGKDIGARLLSVALTNLPFLPSLAPLAAKNRDTESQAQDDEESMADAKELEAKNVDLTSKLSDSESKRAALEAKVAEASLRLNEVESKRSALEAENKLLRDWKTQREEGDLKSEVDTAFSTYKDSHRLTDAQRESMLVLARADLEAFRRLYPPVAPQQRHLLRDLSGGRVVEPPVRDDKPTLRTLTDKLMRERRLSFEEAQIAAARELGVRQLVAR